MRAPYLIVYEYGQGAVWADIFAESQADIERDFPELTVVHNRPAWMTDRELDRIREVHTSSMTERSDSWQRSSMPVAGDSPVRARTVGLLPIRRSHRAELGGIEGLARLPRHYYDGYAPPDRESQPE
jgi:hypothetical protein